MTAAEFALGEPKPMTFVIDRLVTVGAGTEGQLHLLLCGLVDRGYSPVLFVLDGGKLVDTSAFPYPVRVVGRSSIKSLACWWRLLKVAKAERRRGSRLLHCFFNDCSVICPPIFFLSGFRVLISRRDMGFWYTPTYLWLLKLTRRFVDGVVVNSQAVGEVTSVKEGYVRDKIHVIYNALSPASFEPASDPGLECVDRLPHEVRLVLVANLRAIKRISDAVAALASLKEVGLEARLFVVGAGDSSSLKALAEDLGVVDRLHFLGSRSDVPAILEHMDIGLNCSESEGYSNAIVEYMYAGLPVVASEVGGNVEAVLDGETGFLYPVGRVHELANRILTIAGDTALRSKMGDEGHAVATERHSYEAVLSQFAALYTRM